MSASALLQQDHGEFVTSLTNFAEALFGPPTVGGQETAYPRGKAVADAISAASASQEVGQARILAYRAIVGRFLRASVDSLPPMASERQDHLALTDADLTIVAFHQLAPFEKASLLLVVVENFSYADAATVMDLEVGSLIDALARGREAFAARLACSKFGGRSHLRIVG